MKKIIVAGSSSGIGRAITEKLLAENFAVIGLARDHQKFTPENSNYFPYAIDFAEIKSLESKLKLLLKEHPDIEAVIAGAGYGQFAHVEQFKVADMQRIMDVNFLSQAILIKTVLPGLKTRKSGKVIVMASESALYGGKRGSLYCASKFALRGFALSLRKECMNANVAVSIVNPGLVDTPFFDSLDFHPGKQPENAIQPEQVASLVCTILAMANNCVIEEITLQPMQKTIVFF